MTQPDSRLDLVFERVVPVKPSLVWLAWTDPHHLKKWFTPKPWTTIDCEIDLRPGGIFRTTMRSPEGQEFPTEGCYLEVVKDRRLTWTTALKAGWRPAQNVPSDLACANFPFTCVLELEPEGEGTRYRATALHADEAGRRQHAELGFHEGWGRALDQLVALAKEM